MSEERMHLRLLTGEKRDAQMVLESVRYSIGSGREDDIRVLGDGVSEDHLQAVFADGVLTLLSSRGAIYVGESQVVDFPRDVGALEVITLGAVSFTFGVAGSEWPQAPDISALLDSPVANLGSRKGKFVAVSLSGILLLLVLLSGVAFWLTGSAGDESSAEEFARGRAARLERLQSALHGDASFRRVRLEIPSAGAGGSGGSGGNLLASLSGVVRDDSSLEHLRDLAEATAGSGERIRVRVRTLEQVNAEIGESLRLTGANLEHGVTIGDTGDLLLEVSGVVPDDLFAARVRKALEADAPFLDGVKFDLMTPDVLTARVDRRLMGAEGLSQIHLRFLNGSLVAEGFLFSDELEALEDLVSEAVADLSFEVPLRVEAVQIPALPGRVGGILLGPHPVARMEDGAGGSLILREGDTIAGRYLVRRIESSGLLLEYEGNSVRLPVSSGGLEE
ncbi:MAG: hypothetical protein OD811_03620 [Alphaproteobacteria bacterium]